jgi:hypothetical protein
MKWDGANSPECQIRTNNDDESIIIHNKIIKR